MVIYFYAKNVHYSFVKFRKNFAITKIAICFDSFDNFETGRVLYFAKLRNTKIIVFCRALRPGMHNIRPAGQMWPAEALHLARQP